MGLARSREGAGGKGDGDGELGLKQKMIAEADLLVGGEADAEVLAAKLGIPKQSVYSYRNKYREAIKKRLEKRGYTAETIGRRK